MTKTPLRIGLPRRRVLQSMAAGATMLGMGWHPLTQQVLAQGSPKPLKLGLNLWSGFMPWQTIIDKKLFEASGVEAEVLWFPVLSDQLNAFNTGRLDIIGATMTDFLSGVTRGVKAKVIGVTDISLGADAIVVDPSITSIKDFVGKQASIEVGTVGHQLFLTALISAGMDPKSVKIINQTADTAAAALIAGKASIIYTYEPFVSQATSEGKGKVIFSSKDVPGLVPDLFCVQQSTLDQQPEAVQKVLNTWFDVFAFRQKNLQEVLAIEVKRAGISIPEYQALQKGFKWLTAEEALKSLQPGDTTESMHFTAKEVANFMLSQKLLEQAPPEFSTLIEDRFLQQYLAKKS